jgi:hypothetical protein
MSICFKCRESIEKQHSKHGLHKKCFKDLFNLIDDEEDFINIYLPKTAIPSENQLYQETFLHGNFKKYSAIIGKKQYILKPTTPEYPELSKSEYLCNQLAEAIGLKVPKYYLIYFRNEGDCFLSYNFMQDYYQGADLKHIYHFMEKDRYTVEELLKVIERETQRLSELQEIIKLCLFDALIGNNDRHGRNIGLIATGGVYALSPFYDNTSYFATEDDLFLGADLNPRGSIATASTKEPMIKDYADEFIRLGYKNELDKFIKNLDIAELESLIQRSFLSDKRKKAMISFIIKGYQELHNVL